MLSVKMFIFCSRHFFLASVLLLAKVYGTPVPFSISEAVGAALARGESKVIIPAGVHRLISSPGKPHLHLRDVENFEIDATGATLVFASEDQAAVVFERCRNVIFRGAILTYDSLPYSQGRIESIQPDRNRIRVRVAAGYPTRFTHPPRGGKPPPFYVFDPRTRQWKTDTPDLYPSRIEPVVDGIFDLVLEQSVGPDVPIVAGDLIAWRGVGGADIRLSDCASMQLLDVTIKGGRGFCVHESGGEGGSHYRFAVTYPSLPAGATEKPLLASNADAFHSSGVRRGPLLEGCHFEGMPDDGIAIHGAYALVVGVDSVGITLDTRAVAWRKGDIVRVLDEKGVVRSEAVVTAIRSEPNYTSAFPTKLRVYADPLKARYATLTLNRDVLVQPGWLVSNAHAVGSHFQVRDCIIRNHRARGILIKASHGRIENNLIEGSTMAGIVVSPEIGYWNESDFSRDIEIRRNTVRRVGTAHQPWNPMAGALTVGAYEAGAFVPLPGGHEDVRIIDNIFEENDGTNILVTSAQRVMIDGNHFVRPMWNASTRGADRLPKTDALVQVREASEVDFKDNEIVDAGPIYRERVRIDGASHGIRGAEEGFFRRPTGVSPTPK